MPLPTLLRPRGKHHVTETARPVVASPPAKIPERGGFVYGVPPGGMDEIQSGIGGSTQSDRKSMLGELYEAYLACPWAWAAVQSIARTITAGGLVTDWTADTGEGDQEAPDKPPAVLALETLIGYCNPQQNIRQLLRNVIADLEVFGDAYIEVTWAGNLPVALYNQDSPTTTPIADSHGVVTGYVQVTDFGQRAEFEPREIIHISLDSARPGVLGVSPMQAALGPVTSWLFAAGTGKEEFKKGLPPQIHADFPAAAGVKDMREWRDQYATRNLGARNIGAPIITKGGVGLRELQTGKITDVINGKNQCRDEILSIFGVPPAKAGVIEAGNLGGGTGEAQDKTYRVDTCGPVAELVLEKINFHITLQAFHITDWTLKFGEVDYRDSVIVEGIRSQRLRDGVWTLNKYRAEIGEPPVPGGDDAVLVDRQNLVLWSDMKAMSAAVVAGKGAPGVAAGETPPGGEPLAGDAPPGDGPPGDDPGAPGQQQESLRAGQIARYQARLHEALGRMALIRETASLASQVRDQLAANFPPEATAWVDDAAWSGPVNVGADHIDTSNRQSWAAASDGRVEKFRAKLRKRIAAGQHLKPAILVRPAGSEKDIIADGHHRALASIDEGQPVWAYVGRVKTKTGPWDEMHLSQQEGK